MIENIDKNSTRFSWKFYLGIILILLSFIIGKITTIMFFIYFDDKYLRWLALAVYLLSWPMLLWGAWWLGKESYDKLKKYLRYQFYRESIKNRTAKAYHAAKEKTWRFGESAKTRTKLMQAKAKERTRLFHETARNTRLKFQNKAREGSRKIKEKMKRHQNSKYL